MRICRSLSTRQVWLMPGIHPTRGSVPRIFASTGWVTAQCQWVPTSFWKKPVYMSRAVISVWGDWLCDSSNFSSWCWNTESWVIYSAFKQTWTCPPAKGGVYSVCCLAYLLLQLSAQSSHSTVIMLWFYLNFNQNESGKDGLGICGKNEKDCGLPDLVFFFYVCGTSYKLWREMRRWYDFEIAPRSLFQHLF